MLVKTDVSDYGEPIFTDKINDIEFRVIIGERAEMYFENEDSNKTPFGTLYIEVKNNDKLDKLCSQIVRILKEYENE